MCLCGLKGEPLRLPQRTDKGVAPVGEMSVRTPRSTGEPLSDESSLAPGACGSAETAQAEPCEIPDRAPSTNIFKYAQPAAA